MGVAAEIDVTAGIVSLTMFVCSMGTDILVKLFVWHVRLRSVFILGGAVPLLAFAVAVAWDVLGRRGLDVASVVRVERRWLGWFWPCTL